MLKKLSIILLITGFISSIAFAQSRKEKSAWYLGIGIGYGEGYTKSSQENNEDIYSFNDRFSAFDSKFKLSGHLGAGAIVGIDTHFGFEFAFIFETSKYDKASLKYEQALQIYNFFAMITYFPFKLNLFLKGGAGLSVLSNKTSGDIDSKKNYTGFGGSISLGYAFPLNRTFHLCLDFTFSYQNFDLYENDDKSLKSSMFWSVNLSLYKF